MTDDLERTFLDAIRRNPDDEDARTVYADWLEQRGDPRGEYLRLESLTHRLRRIAELTPSIDAGWLEAVSRRYDVVLGNPGPNKIMVIKEIRQITGLGLKDAKDLCDAASDARPTVLKRGLERHQADAIAAMFADTHANIGVIPHMGGTAPLAAGDTSPTPLTAGAVDVMLVAVQRDRMIAAIKVVREVTGLGLKEAKDIVDAVVRGSPYAIFEGVDVGRGTQVVAQFDAVGARAELRYAR